LQTTEMWCVSYLMKMSFISECNILSFVPFKPLCLTLFMCLFNRVEIKSTKVYQISGVMQVEKQNIFHCQIMCVATQIVDPFKLFAFRAIVWFQTTKAFSVYHLIKIRTPVNEIFFVSCRLNLNLWHNVVCSNESKSCPTFSYERRENHISGFM
jgi:hypothetical protein